MNLDPDKLVVLFVIALMVLGPTRLPEVARTLGRWMAEVRKYTSGIQGELHSVLGEPLKQTAALRDEFRSAIAEPRAALEVGAREVRTSFGAGAAAAAGSGLMEGPLAGLTTPGAGPEAQAVAPLGAEIPVGDSAPSPAVPDDPGLN